jgi:two-component system phosphate regulon sensor histidine kinase PhoR
VHTKGSITGRHLAIAVLVMVVVNVQLTWWIIFTIGQARDRLELERALLDQRARAWAEMSATVPSDHVRLVPQGLEIVPAAQRDAARPAVDLGGSRSGWVIRPTEAAWGAILAEYRRHIVMMTSEGAFFAVLLVVFMGLLWRTLRREIALERQHHNFLSAITHELKSPIAAIRIALETVVRGRADEAMSKKFIGNALADTDRLDGLVQKVLHATRFGSGSAGIRPSRAPLGVVIERAVAAFKPRADAVGATVATEIDHDLMADFDDEAMTIVVSNLLENALKYGGEPAVITVALRAENDRVELDVRDNGSGIPEEAIPFIFDRFYRAGDEMTRTSQGTGLGLYLVQRIMKAHHGAVSVASTGADGSTLRVVLPGVGMEEDGE